jgi:hypothetical protein
MEPRPGEPLKLFTRRAPSELPFRPLGGEGPGKVGVRWGVRRGFLAELSSVAPHAARPASS